MNDLKIFSNEEFGNVRVIEKNGEGYFNLKDVCEILEIKNPRDCKNRLNEAGVVTTDIRCESENGIIQTRAMTFINESNLYKCIFQSRKASAERFTDWVTTEVLPSIRKNGAYMTSQTIDDIIENPDNMIKLLTKLKEEKEHRIELESQMKIDRPKVIFAESVANSNNLILIRDLAKIIKQNGREIGEKRLFSWMRMHNYLTAQNTPTQKAMELKLFRTVEHVHTNHLQQLVTTLTTKVTGKGQQYFINKFAEEE